MCPAPVVSSSPRSADDSSEIQPAPTRGSAENPSLQERVRGLHNALGNLAQATSSSTAGFQGFQSQSITRKNQLIQDTSLRVSDVGQIENLHTFLNLLSGYSVSKAEASTIVSFKEDRWGERTNRESLSLSIDSWKNPFSQRHVDLDLQSNLEVFKNGEKASQEAKTDALAYLIMRRFNITLSDKPKVIELMKQLSEPGTNISDDLKQWIKPFFINKSEEGCDQSYDDQSRNRIAALIHEIIGEGCFSQVSQGDMAQDIQPTNNSQPQSLNADDVISQNGVGLNASESHQQFLQNSSNILLDGSALQEKIMAANEHLQIIANLDGFDVQAHFSSMFGENSSLANMNRDRLTGLLALKMALAGFRLDNQWENERLPIGQDKIKTMNQVLEDLTQGFDVEELNDTGHGIQDNALRKICTVPFGLIRQNPENIGNPWFQKSFSIEFKENVNTINGISQERLFLIDLFALALPDEINVDDVRFYAIEKESNLYKNVVHPNQNELKERLSIIANAAKAHKISSIRFHDVPIATFTQKSNGFVNKVATVVHTIAKKFYASIKSLFGGLGTMQSPNSSVPNGSLEQQHLPVSPSIPVDENTAAELNNEPITYPTSNAKPILNDDALKRLRTPAPQGDLSTMDQYLDVISDPIPRESTTLFIIPEARSVDEQKL